ncbi:hypothetical protein NKH77_28950 [Streptomyces sp. M19]
MSGTEELDGRDYTDGPGTAKVDLSKIRTPGGLEDAPWAGQDEDGDDKPIPFLVRATLDPLDAGRFLLAFGGRPTGCRSASSSNCWRTTPNCGPWGGRPAAAGRPGAGAAQRRSRGPYRPSARPRGLVHRPAGGHVGHRRRGNPVLTLSASSDVATVPGPTRGRRPVRSTPTRWRTPAPVAPGAHPLRRPGRGPGHRRRNGRPGDRHGGPVRARRRHRLGRRLGPRLRFRPRLRLRLRDRARVRLRVGPRPRPRLRFRGKVTPRGGRVLPRSSSGQPTPGLTATAPASPVFTAPVTASPSAAASVLPPSTEVLFAPGATDLAEDDEDAVLVLATQVAIVALRHRRAGVALPEAAIRGHGARTDTVREVFRRGLDEALVELQRDLPTGEPRLVADDLTVTPHDEGQATGEQALRVAVETTVPPIAVALWGWSGCGSRTRGTATACWTWTRWSAACWAPRRTRRWTRWTAWT